MRDVDAISIAGILYALVLIAVTAIFFRAQLTWPALGAATALFNHSIMINITKNGFNKKKYMFHIFFRFVMYAIITAFMYFDVKDAGTQDIILSGVFLLLGMITVKMGVFLHYLPFIRKHTTSYKEEVLARQKRLEEESKADVD